MPHIDNALITTTDQETQRERLGQVVRSLREQQGLSVRTLAKASGFSPSFISQVENGLASPSIASMEKIAHALGVSLSGFFAAERSDPDSPVVVRAGEGEELASEWSQATLHALSPSWESRTLSPVLLTLAPGGRSGSEPTGHQGEEFAIVLSGAVRLRLKDTTHALESGDAIHLTPETPHQWENLGNRRARILLVSSVLARR